MEDHVLDPGKRYTEQEITKQVSLCDETNVEVNKKIKEEIITYYIDAAAEQKLTYKEGRNKLPITQFKHLMTYIRQSQEDKSDAPERLLYYVMHGQFKMGKTVGWKGKVERVVLERSNLKFDEDDTTPGISSITRNVTHFQGSYNNRLNKELARYRGVMIKPNDAKEKLAVKSRQAGRFHEEFVVAVDAVSSEDEKSGDGKVSSTVRALRKKNKELLTKNKEMSAMLDFFKTELESEGIDVDEVSTNCVGCKV